MSGSMKRRVVRGLTVLTVCSAAALTTVQAAEPQAVATYRDWTVFTRDVDNDVVCYAVSEAKEKSPTSAQHGDVFFIVATWKSGAAKDQPSLMVGYKLQDKSEPVVRVGSDKWEMYASQNEAFVDKTSDEQSLIRAMRRGSDMRISALSARGTATSYTISLLGVTAALDRVKSACN